MNPEYEALLLQGPPACRADDVWARLCCEQALLALSAGNYAVGAVLVNEQNEWVCGAENQVFTNGFDSSAHAEMKVLSELERTFPHLDREGLTLYVSLQPCLMCYGRLLLAGITKVRYLAVDRDGGFKPGWYPLPPVWKALSARLSLEPMDAQSYWVELAGRAVGVLQDPAQLRSRVLAAWRGRNPGGQ